MSAEMLTGILTAESLEKPGLQRGGEEVRMVSGGFLFKKKVEYIYIYKGLEKDFHFLTGRLKPADYLGFWGE